MTTQTDELFAEPGSTGFEGIVVRQLCVDDLEQVVRIDARVFGRSRREYYRLKLSEATMNASVRISLAAEFEGRFAGFLLGRLYYGEFGVPEPTAIIDSIGVDPGVQGHHVGSALLDQLEMNLRGIGIAAVRTEVEWERTNLLHFFATHGFKPAPILCLQKRMAPES